MDEDVLARIPGDDEPDDEKKRDRLAAWIKTVRNKCRDLDRGDVADNCIGKLLSNAPAGKDNVWPCEPVRDVLEEVQSERMFSGVHIGLYNARGAHWRGEGGDQERELADKYRKWANALQYSHPFVASKLLMGMVKTYEQEASREDTAAGIRRRLR